MSVMSRIGIIKNCIIVLLLLLLLLKVLLMTHANPLHFPQADFMKMP